MLYLDLESEFDIVCHQTLIHKLTKVNIPSKFTKINKVFVMDAEYMVRLEGTMSAMKDVAAGVPQASPLNPLLFLHYINDFPKNKFTQTMRPY